MGLFQCKIFSKELFRNINVNITLPTPDSGDFFQGIETPWPSEGKKYQVLWLLHGFIADESDWQRFSGIERYAQENFIAVVMPDAYNSMYANDPYAAQYYNFYTKELPEMLRHIFPISSKRENNFIAGLSMGGYGAFKAAFLNPQNYAAAASLSGGLDLGRITTNRKGIDRYVKLWMQSIFGREMEYWNPEKDDLKKILQHQIKSGVNLPKLYQCCGTEDFLHEANIEFREYARSCGIDITYEESEGIHNFDFWDPYIRKILKWLPLTGTLVE